MNLESLEFLPTILKLRPVKQNRMAYKKKIDITDSEKYFTRHEPLQFLFQKINVNDNESGMLLFSEGGVPKREKMYDIWLRRRVNKC